jgi:hypothetical protein
MKSPRTLPTSVVSLLCLLLVLLALPALMACGRSSDTTLAPTTSQNTMLTGGGGYVPQTTTTQPTNGSTAAANILFRDDFQDGDTEGWQVSGTWVVQQDGDIYTFAASGAGYAYVPAGVSWPGDYAFKASYQLDAGTLAFSFDASKDGRYYVSVGPDLISLVKEDAADAKTVLTQAQAPAAGQMHYITMAKQSGTIQVYVDKTLWLAATDAAPLAAGTIAVGSAEGTSAWVDEVLVNKIGRALPPGTPAVQAVDPGAVVAPPDGGGDLGELSNPDDGSEDPDDDNVIEDIPLPSVTFTGRVEDGEGEASNYLTVPPFTNVVLEWSVEDAAALYLDHVAVQAVSDMVVSTRETYSHELEVTGLDGATHFYYVEVWVEELVHGPSLGLEVQVTPRGAAGLGGVLVDVKVTNAGDEDAHNVTVIWSASEMSLVTDKSQTLPLVEAGGQATFAWTYTYGASGDHTWLARATMDPPDGGVDQPPVWAQGEIET